MASVSNMEEAASLASEFVLSLDNLPHEVQFLLSEIRLKDTRSQELQQDINKETAKYLKHALRGQTTQKDSSVHTKTAADFAAAAALADEKVALAERLVALLSRTRARLDHDLGKMLVLQGELDPSQLSTYSSINGPGGATVGAAPIVAAIESMRTNVAPEPVFSQSVSTAGTNKRRKLTGTTALKVSSPAPSIVPPVRGRAAAQSRASPVASRGRRTAAAELDEDLEGEEDVEDAEGEDANGGDDDGIYCFCQRTSFGEMVACDNEHCPYQWFHLECVGLTTAPSGTWYCKECAPKFAAPARKRGRK